MPATTGREAFIATNLSRVIQGLPWTLQAPNPITVADNDLIVLSQGLAGPPPVYPLLVHVDATWTRGPGALGPNHLFEIWAEPRMTKPESKIYTSGLTFIGTITAAPETPIRLDAILTGKPVIVLGGCISLFIGTAEDGIAPFASTRAALRNVAE